VLFAAVRFGIVQWGGCAEVWCSTCRVVVCQGVVQSCVVIGATAVCLVAANKDLRHAALACTVDVRCWAASVLPMWLCCW
jgi:hypothetical protein